MLQWFVFHTWRRSGYMQPRHGELTFQSCLASHLCGLFTSFFQTNGSTTSRLWASVTRNVCEHSEMTCAADGTRRKNAGERSLIPVAAASWRSLVPVLRALCDAARNACTSLAQYLNLNAQARGCHAQGRRCMTAQEGARDGTRPTCCYHRPLRDGHLVIHPGVRDSRRTLTIPIPVPTLGL